MPVPHCNLHNLHSSYNHHGYCCLLLILSEDTLAVESDSHTYHAVERLVLVNVDEDCSFHTVQSLHQHPYQHHSAKFDDNSHHFHVHYIFCCTDHGLHHQDFPALYNKMLDFHTDSQIDTHCHNCKVLVLHLHLTLSFFLIH